MTRDSTPRSFSDIYALHSLMDPNNEAIRKLNSVQMQVALISTLGEMGQRKFIPLVHERDRSRISFALYAGDGVVTKVTPEIYMVHEAMPFVVPPFAQKHINNDDAMSGALVIENYPYIDTKSVAESDVKAMRALLDAHGMRFREQDDRADNIGRLPDGTLAVLDSNAVMFKEGYDPVKLAQDVQQWQKKIATIYPAFYAQGYSFKQTDKTDFDLTHATPRLEPESRLEPAVDGRSWFDRLLNRSGKNVTREAL